MNECREKGSPRDNIKNKSSVCQDRLLADAPVGSGISQKQAVRAIVALAWGQEGRARWRRRWAMGLLHLSIQQMS